MSRYDEDREVTGIYKVIVNHKEQYSIWPAEKNNPLGWSDAGKSGPSTECLAYIKEVWADISKKMEAMAKEPPPPLASNSKRQEKNIADEFREGDHPVEAELEPEKK